MPRRKKAPDQDVKMAVLVSLREWGVRPAYVGKHAQFSNKIVMQAVEQTNLRNGPVFVFSREKKIPDDREEAIYTVYVAELKEYLDDKTFRLRSSEVKDFLEFTADEPLLQWPPYNREGRKKKCFQQFSDAALDPFTRFTITPSDLSPAALAYEHYEDLGWMCGYSFEAIVASYAAFNEACYRCQKKFTLVWCGGSDTSWRDMYCRACYSCYEIKSKANVATIDKIFRFDNAHGGSYLRWCEEEFSDRVTGTDYIVYVAREATNIGSLNRLAWPVVIAEIGSALPSLCERSFAEWREKIVSLKTVLTLKNRQTWFHIPVGEDANLDLSAVFRRAYDNVFPGERETSTFFEEEKLTIGDIICLSKDSVDSKRSPTRVDRADSRSVKKLRESFLALDVRSKYDELESNLGAEDEFYKSQDQKQLRRGKRF